jgi:spore coat polysaccharide biosynthesis protein SpsF
VKTLLIVQARTDSTRLPNKAILPLAGAPLLERMIQRVLAATSDFNMVVATSTEKEDDPIRELCRSIDVKCFSGSIADLLDNHFQVACDTKADVVVRIPSDCPLIDPSIIDRVLGFYFRHADDYDCVSNLHPPTYPDGNDVEVMPFPVLAAAWKEAVRPLERGQITPFFLERQERFRIGNVEWESGLNYAKSHRWRVEYREDYEFVSAVYDQLWSVRRPVFSLQDILNLLAQRPDIAARNAHLAGAG